MTLISKCWPLMHDRYSEFPSSRNDVWFVFRKCKKCGHVKKVGKYNPPSSNEEHPHNCLNCGHYKVGYFDDAPVDEWSCTFRPIRSGWYEWSKKIPESYACENHTDSVLREILEPARKIYQQNIKALNPNFFDKIWRKIKSFFDK